MALFDGTVEDFKAALDEVVNRLATVGQGLVTQASRDFEAAATRVVDHALQGVNSTVAGLAGWNLTVAPITVKLNAPKGIE